jgi:acyl carrier protein
MTTAPTRSTTDLLVDIFRDVLGDPTLDADGDFYAAGGDSLAAIGIIGRLEAERGVEVPVALVFAYPSPAELADVVDADFPAS